ncbi:MAG: hypothetical protein U0793_32520 [Gemmataceae bacterium]
MTPETPVQPKLGDLLARYLQRQREAEQAGLASFTPGDVTPYDAGPVQPIDPKPAWDAATAALLGEGRGGGDKLQPPPHWPQLVAGHEPAVALAFAACNFPQLVRNFYHLLHEANLASFRPQAGRPVAAPGLEDWAEQAIAKGQFPQAIVALGAMRLAKQFDLAEAFIARHDAAVPAAQRAAWENEKAALAWHKGDVQNARDLWHKQEETLPVLFNRGMADLFLGHVDAARAALTRVVAQLPETSAWHHLARLYLTLAQPAQAR